MFEDPPETVAVTTTYVTENKYPAVYVSHEIDDDGEIIWQFHCTVVPFSMDDALLVRLDTIIGIDSTLKEIAHLPIGYAAKRDTVGGKWEIFKEIDD